MNARLGFVLWLLTLPLAGAIRAEDWPQFRGPDGQGHSAETDLPTHWSETQNVAWKTPIAGLGWSSPAVQGNRIWLTTALEDSNSLRAVCLDRRTGRLLHDVEVFHKTDLGRISAKNSHASPTPVLDGDRVFVHFGAHGTACLTSDGEIVWTKELKYDHRHGPGGSPIVWGDLLIVACDGVDVQYVVALDKHTGQVRWKRDRAGDLAFSTPLAIEVGGVDQIVSSGGKAVVAYSPTNGSELWRCRYEGHSVVPRPIYGNGLVYVCSGYWTPTLYAIRPDGQGDVTDTHVAGALRRGVPHNPSPLLVDDVLYMVSDMGILTAIGAASGAELWHHRLSGGYSASPVYADGRIYLLNEDGLTTVVAAGRTFQQVATNQLEGRSLASPAISGHCIFLRTDQALYCIKQ